MGYERGHGVSIPSVVRCRGKSELLQLGTAFLQTSILEMMSNE